MEKKFNLVAALNGAKIKTRSGKNAKIVYNNAGNKKILVMIYSNISRVHDRTIKYNIDGSRWSPNYEDPEDLVMV